jgi:hypothetical protein
MPCQDYTEIVWTGGSLLVFVCDGAGSAAHSDEGAREAVRAACNFFEQRPDEALGVPLGEACVRAVRAHLVRHAEKRKASLRDFSCTFLAVIVRREQSLLIHVGDGGIVLDFADGRGLFVSAPKKAGEYANQTHFVTEAAPEASIQLFAQAPARIAAFSDGLERLALNLAAGTAQAGFFDRLFDVLLQREGKTPRQYSEELSSRFLQNDAVNQRTDDDKSLALAVNLDKCPLQEALPAPRKTASIETAPESPPPRKTGFIETASESPAPEPPKTPPEHRRPPLDKAAPSLDPPRRRAAPRRMFGCAPILLALVFGLLLGVAAFYFLRDNGNPESTTAGREDVGGVSTTTLSGNPKDVGTNSAPQIPPVNTETGSALTQQSGEQQEIQPKFGGGKKEDTSASTQSTTSSKNSEGGDKNPAPIFPSIIDEILKSLSRGIPAQKSAEEKR